MSSDAPSARPSGAWSLTPSGLDPDLQQLADAAAAALPDASRDLASRWHSLGFDPARHPDPKATLRHPEAARPEADLPPLSVHLPDTGAHEAEVAADRTSRHPDLDIQAVLGEGGMGRVLLARQHSLNRDVAVKTLKAGATPRDRQALIREGVITGSLEHPGIVPIHALGRSVDGRPVLVMKRVEGVPWSTLLHAADHPAWAHWGADTQDRLEAHLHILQQVCNAVDYAHAQGVIHRDIKPANVLLGPFGDVYLVDWGIAFRPGAERDAQVCGTPGYMAPEMALGLPPDERTDVYLLGATLHEVLLGRLRHPQPDVAAAMVSAVASRPHAYPPATPWALADLANQATARDPAQRPPSASAFRHELAAFLAHRSSLDLAATTQERLEQLSGLIDNPLDTRQPDGPQRMDRLAIEIRFALTEALDRWPENPEARHGLEALDALVAKRQERARALEQLARDLDPATAARSRNRVVLGIAIAAVLVALPLLLQGLRYQPTSMELFRASFLPLAATLAGAWIYRKELARSAINRRTAVGLLVAIGGICLNRGLGLWTGLDASVLLALDALQVALLLAFAATSVFPWLIALSLCMLGSAVASALRPAWAFLSFTTGTLVCFLAAGVLAWLRPHAPASRRRRPSD